MKISLIKISNFRSLRSTRIETTDFNILVGQNNCGKTNFFEAIEFFFNGLGRGEAVNDLKFRRDADAEIEVEIEFIGAQEAAGRMQNQSNKTKILKALDESDTVSFKRTSGEPGKRSMFVNGNEVNPGTGFDKALGDFLPKLEYISTKQYYDAVAKFSKSTPIGIMLSGVLAAILEQNPHYLEFQAKFNQLFENDDSEIKVQFDAIGTTVKGFLEKQFPDTTKVAYSGESLPVIPDERLPVFPDERLPVAAGLDH
ncbi:DNA replication and repair protein RecF [Dyadobacter sp. CECT 9275]|uniref:DNA replication and repair protein RecF n=1 Tax=Dyadobacter helix TaxID=2822344 RepID=A0A916NMH3_9BACT|nr:AAA family ATPase [Dyadobacter sp. CECT 9275]CAG5006578.1 DNA replication and repair protein RecF [Dyadobacter sp. CECT 9275]